MAGFDNHLVHVIHLARSREKERTQKRVVHITFARKANSNIRLNTSLLQNSNMMARCKGETVNCILRNPCEIAKSQLSFCKNSFRGLLSNSFCGPLISRTFIKFISRTFIKFRSAKSAEFTWPFRFVSHLNYPVLLQETKSKSDS